MMVKRPQISMISSLVGH